MHFKVSHWNRQSFLFSSTFIMTGYIGWRKATHSPQVVSDGMLEVTHRAYVSTSGGGLVPVGFCF